MLRLGLWTGQVSWLVDPGVRYHNTATVILCAAFPIWVVERSLRAPLASTNCQTGPDLVCRTIKLTERHENKL